MFHQFSHTLPPDLSSPLLCFLFDLILMLNRTVSSWGQNKRQSGGGDYISRTPSQTKGIRKYWRNILCISTESYTDADYHTTTRADAPSALAKGTLRAVSNGGKKSHLEQANTSKETKSAWFEKTSRGLRPRSEPSAVRRGQRKNRSVRTDRGGEGGQSYDDDDLHYHMARLHLITPTKTAAKGERIQATPSSSKDDTDTDVLMSASPREDETGGAQASGKLSSSLRGEERWPENQKESDPAWEALKRRVLYLEEHDGSPLEMGEAERALRELRAQLRRGWAEEKMRMRAREESTRSTKKRRRNAGWWACENGDLLRCTVTVSESSCEKKDLAHMLHFSTRMLSKAPYIDGHRLSLVIFHRAWERYRVIVCATGGFLVLQGLLQGCAGQTSWI